MNQRETYQEIRRTVAGDESHLRARLPRIRRKVKALLAVLGLMTDIPVLRQLSKAAYLGDDEQLIDAIHGLRLCSCWSVRAADRWESSFKRGMRGL